MARDKDMPVVFGNNQVLIVGEGVIRISLIVVMSFVSISGQATIEYCVASC